jgi:acetyl/propionyl-CoA carboxylase alpha subunit
METRPFQKVLVANRGEIAIRICRAVQEEGLRAVAVYETPDQESRHIRVADEAVWIGPGPRKDYLDIDRVIWAARVSGCEAVHPGYGFLAENPEFPRACEEEGLVFIGPPSGVVRDLGDKTVARTLAGAAGVPVIPGSGILPAGDPGLAAARVFADRHGYPLMLKAAAGGGGRGIRRIENAREMAEQMPLAEREARSAFGDERLYLEKGLVRPRHVEVQILADSLGETIHLGTRNCSIQRRHQKLVEAAPGMVGAEVEARLCEAALLLSKKAGYRNAGTVEFLVEPDGSFYFLEINTRLQVEHTVSEITAGIDIVRRQIRVARGLPLDIEQKDVFCRGCAVEMRINAEDPRQNFAPESGKTVSVYLSPGGPGIRLDGFVYQGYTIPADYDSLLVKLTVYGFTWAEATSRLARALRNFVIVGPKTTIPFYRRLVDEEEFRRAEFDTGYLDRHPELFDYGRDDREEAKIAGLLAEIHHRKHNPFAV